jgi:phospholipid/cholesterol/gamma-HCH transport system permease protein
MQENGGWVEIERQGEALVLAAGGRWLVATAAELDRKLNGLVAVEGATAARIDLAGVEMLDTVGAWLVLRTRRRLEGSGIAATIDNVPPGFAPLLDQVAKGEPPQPPPAPRQGVGDTLRAGLELLGKGTVEFFRTGRDLLSVFGLVCVTVLRVLRRPERLRAVALLAQMERTGVTALPIVGLLSFLIGVVIAYQGADQLRRVAAGAEIYTVNLLGIGILRELGVLLTAIIVAGRSGSAFTAEIGAMQVNEEIDAMRMLGLDPIEVLVLPRLLGLVFVLPLLTVYADFMALLGGALMSWVALGIPIVQFVRQLGSAVTDATFFLGILKAPFFATAIALVGCHSGLRVARSAESVGRLTTVSVVHSIFLVIVFDAAFSILFARLHI